MIIVGLTGGIGSGKTTVAKQFRSLGIPIYIADNEAKTLMFTSKVVKRNLIKLFGNEAYLNNQLNKSFIADIIFNDPTFLEKMNAIVHPRVRVHFNKWLKKQHAPYVVKEVAILFENGGNKLCDYVITVVAPKELRIERLLKRDATSIEKVENIMKNQWTDDEKIKHSDFVISNTTLENTIVQVEEIHNIILNSIKS